MSRRRESNEQFSWPTLGIPALVAGIGLTCLLSYTAELGGDLWWHLATGRWIASGAGIPKVDPFTYTALGRPWITHEWLSDFFFFHVHRMGGTNLLIVAKSAIAGLAVLLSALVALANQGRSDGRLAGAAVGVLLAAPLIALRAFPRPHMLTALLLGVLLLLLQMESTTGRRIWRLLLAPLFLLWANLHSGFVLGFAVVLLAWAGEWISFRLKNGQVSSTSIWRERGIALLLVFAASLINPHHIQAHLYPFHLIAREEVRSSIVELRSIFHPAYRGAWFPVETTLACSIAAFLVIHSRRPVWSLVLPGILLAGLSIASIRNLSEFSVLLPALIGSHADRLGSRRMFVPALCIAVIAIAATGGIAAVRYGTPIGRASVQKIGRAIDPGSRPESAALFLRETRPPTRVFNLLVYGGYLIYELGPETKVFVDGRLDIFPPGFLRSYTRMLATGEGWKEVVDRYGIGIAVVNHVPQPERDQGLRALLRDDPEWVCVMAGDYTLVYARRVPENAEIIRRFGLPFDPSARFRDFIGDFASRATTMDLDRAVAALESMHAIAPTEIAPSLFAGQILDRTGHSSEAAVFVRRAVDGDPTSLPLQLSLVETLVRADSVQAARDVLAAILSEHPESASALSALGLLERGAGRLDAAIVALEQAAAIDPGNHVIQVRLGVVKAESGRIEEGKRHLHRALGIRPGDPWVLGNLQAIEALEAQGRR